MTVHTHYDNLKVTRKAPHEVIRAAYRAMAQKYHPDINSSSGATQVMRLLNEAWEVLGDPVQRAAHDKWIAEQEALQSAVKSDAAKKETDSAHKWPRGARTNPYRSEQPFDYKYREKQHSPRPHTSQATSPQRPTSAGVNAPRSLLSIKTSDGVVLMWVAVSFVGAIWLFVGLGLKNEAAKQPLHLQTLARIVEASTVPNDQPRFARCAGSYEPEKCRELERNLFAETLEQTRIRQERLESATALSREQVQKNISPSAGPKTFSFEEAYAKPLATNNPQQTLAPFVNRESVSEHPSLSYGPSRHLGKVFAQGGRSSIEIDNSSGLGDTEVRFYLDGKKPSVRAMLVRRGESFKSTGIRQGSYVVRWRALGSNQVFEANQPADLSEERTEYGTRYSQVRLTLYRVRDGNLKTSAVPEGEF